MTDVQPVHGYNGFVAVMRSEDDTYCDEFTYQIKLWKMAFRRPSDSEAGVDR